MNATSKLFLENKIIQRKSTEAFNVTKMTNVKAGHEILIILLVVYVKIKFK